MRQARTGVLAASEAFVRAGNDRAAERELRALLAADPADSEACVAFSHLLSKQKRHVELEAFAKDWVGRDGDSIAARLTLVCSFAGRADRKQAEAALRQFRERFPFAQTAAANLESLIDANCSGTASAWDRLGAMCQGEGDEAKALQLRSRATFERGQLAEALRLGEDAWRAGCAETEFVKSLAELAFFCLRFRTARRYAALALKAEPRHPYATELRVLTYLAWFPPFLLLQALIRVSIQFRFMRPWSGAVSGSIFSGLTYLAFHSTPIRHMPGSKAAVLTALALAVVYLLYLPHLGTITERWNRWRGTDIRLQNY